VRIGAPPLLLRDVEIDGARVDCRITAGTVETVGVALPAGPAAVVIDGRGGALLPGLADHHLHLFALAVAGSSVDLESGRTLADIAAAADLVRAGGGWVRVVGWDDEAHGGLDRDRLDHLVDDVPVRVQHRSGAVWVLNTVALDRLSAAAPPPEGAERDASGRLTGRVWRADEWLRTGAGALPDLEPVGALLAGLGITAITDASPKLDRAAVQAVHDAVAGGALPQRVKLLGADDLPTSHPRLTIGPRKLVVADHDLPDPDVLARAIADAHEAGRAVAVHCVSRVALALTISALRVASARDGDRIEHCAVADLAAVEELRSLGVTVVTQPSLVARRGSDYLDRHDVDEHGDLWRYRSLLDHGVRTVPSSDAPYGELDPWATIGAAVTRLTPDGRVLGAGERVAADVVLAGMLTSLDRPGGPPRRVAPGAPADLVLLRSPLAAVLAAPAADEVAMTIAAGRVVHTRAGL
jgi:predicted amidohydrolase YtcJ